MGTYDTLHHGDRQEQVKLWGKGLRHLHVGDRVGPPRGGLAPAGTYTVVMHAGGYVHVAEGVVTGWEDVPGSGPQLMTGGGRFVAVDWPGGPFGPWYRDDDVPPHRRTTTPVDGECPRLGRPTLRLVHRDDSGSQLDRARAEVLADVAARLDAGLDEPTRLDTARALLADRTGHSSSVAREAVAALLEVSRVPERAGRRLVDLLSSAEPDAPEWRNAAAFVTDHAAALPTPELTAVLALLAAALPTPPAPTADPPSQPVVTGGHPRVRHRRSQAADLDDDWLHEIGRYGEPYFLGAAEAAVASHGAAVLPAVPLTFWGRDIVVPELAAPLLAPVLGRELTPAEIGALTWALDDLPGGLAGLDADTLAVALRRTLDRHAL
jgi:hypothetical protein